MASCTIELLSHSFVIRDVDSRFKPLINGYAKQFIKTKKERMGRHMVTVPDRVYAWSNVSRTEYRFHRNQLEDFLAFSDRHGFPRPIVTERPMYAPKSACVSLLESWKPRLNQVPIIDYALGDGHSKVVTLQTGQGKTSISLKVGERLANRVAVLALGRFFDKWKSDVIKQYRLAEGEYVAIRGTKQLYKLMQSKELGKKNLKVILITLGTMKNYIDEYADDSIKKPKWFVPPDKLWELLGVGYRITDEVHMHFHLNYIIDLFTHVPKAIYLSATLETDDPLTNQMNRISFPMLNRMNGGAFIKISDVIAVHYGLEKRGSIACSGFGGSYSHSVFEGNLLKKAAEKRRYFEMVVSLIKEYHFPRWKPGQRLLIFAARVELCQELVEYIGDRFEGVSVCKYTSEDPLEIIEQHDITVTTIGSAGTALDIEGLLTCIMTTSINSRQANEQALGRLRDLHIEGTTPLFLYLVCDDIPKQVEYHNRKKADVFANKTLSYRNVNYYIKI